MITKIQKSSLKNASYYHIWKKQLYNFCIHEAKHQVRKYHLHKKMHTKASVSYSYLQLPQKMHKDHIICSS